MTTLRQDPGRSVAGKGLLINLKWRRSCLKATSVTCRLQSPTLQTDTVRCGRRPHLIPPKTVEPATASWPEGTLPDTAIIRGPAGSSLLTVTVADLGPKLDGWNRIGTCRESPPSMANGYDSTWGMRNSPEEEKMLVTDSVHL